MKNKNFFLVNTKNEKKELPSFIESIVDLSGGIIIFKDKEWKFWSMVTTWDILLQWYDYIENIWNYFLVKENKDSLYSVIDIISKNKIVEWFSYIQNLEENVLFTKDFSLSNDAGKIIHFGKEWITKEYKIDYKQPLLYIDKFIKWFAIIKVNWLYWLIDYTWKIILNWFQYLSSAFDWREYSNIFHIFCNNWKIGWLDKNQKVIFEKDFTFNQQWPELFWVWKFGIRTFWTKKNETQEDVVIPMINEKWYWSYHNINWEKVSDFYTSLWNYNDWYAVVNTWTWNLNTTTYFDWKDLIKDKNWNKMFFDYCFDFSEDVWFVKYISWKEWFIDWTTKEITYLEWLTFSLRKVTNWNMICETK